MDIQKILNDVLNKALIKNRIQNPNSNTIADFVNEYTESEQLTLTNVVKSLKDEDIPIFEEYTQNYGYKRIGNSNVYKNEGTYKDRETLLKEYKKEYFL